LINGGPPSDELTYFLNVSPGWIDTMKIPFIAGRDFLSTDTYPSAVIVNQTFAKRYFGGESPLGKSFEQPGDASSPVRLRIVGVVRDARYRGMREAIPPVAFVPFHAIGKDGAAKPVKRATFVVRTTTANPLALASLLRREIPRARSEFRVSNIRTQAEINRALTVRERLLAMLALFFAVVALLLAGIGLYGVIDYTVLQRRRELGIRIAIGAPLIGIARHVVTKVFCMVLVGAAAGLTLGLIAGRFLQDLLFQVALTGFAMLALPSLTLLGAALLAAIPPVIRAVRIDPVAMLRQD
jgi:predicted lysophospholipase L1 biosynthesis ABC-type transport system permease subunit